MARIDVVVMNDDIRMRPSRLSQHSADRFALKQVEFERDRQDEVFGGVDGLGQRVFCSEPHNGLVTQYWCASFGHSARLAFSFTPSPVVRIEISREDNRGGLDLRACC